MKFPKFLYVRAGAEGTGEEYLLAEADPAAHATVNQIEQVAKYQRVEIGTVTAPATYTGDEE